MESNVFTIGLYCRRTRLNTKGEATLYLTLNQGDQRKMLSLGLKLKIDYWDEAILLVLPFFKVSAARSILVSCGAAAVLAVWEQGRPLAEEIGRAHV